MTQRLLIAILFASICVQARANTANFNALTAGTSYTAPSTFSNGGLDFDVLYGLGPLNVVAASSPMNPSFTGNYLNLTSNVALNVNLPTGASQIQFDFILGDPAVALAINGAFINYNQIPTTVNGVTVTELLGSKTNPWGSIAATGNISTFIIIGTTFSVDNLNATLLPGVPGDYNKNNVVDAGDYVIWRKSINTPSGYHSWRSNFGATGGGAGSSVASVGIPEPSTLVILLVGLPCVVIRRRNRLRALETC
jgi:hypothetical protein